MRFLHRAMIPRLIAGGLWLLFVISAGADGNADGAQKGVTVETDRRRVRASAAPEATDGNPRIRRSASTTSKSGRRVYRESDRQRHVEVDTEEVIERMPRPCPQDLRKWRGATFRQWRGKLLGPVKEDAQYLGLWSVPEQPLQQRPDGRRGIIPLPEGIPDPDIDRFLPPHIEQWRLPELHPPSNVPDIAPRYRDFEAPDDNLRERLPIQPPQPPDLPFLPGEPPDIRRGR